MKKYRVYEWSEPLEFKRIITLAGRPDVETLILGMLKDGHDFAVEIDDDEKGD